MYDFETPGYSLVKPDMKTFLDNIPSKNRRDADRNNFEFLCKKIEDYDVNSRCPFYNCQEDGHHEHLLDSICTHPDCKYQGLACKRCVYLKHMNHEQKVQPLNHFVSRLISSSQNYKKQLINKQNQCLSLRDGTINQLKSFLEEIIEHFSQVASQLIKHYNTFENSFESYMIKSDIIVHRILDKQHIPQAKFQEYIRLICQNDIDRENIVLNDYQHAMEQADVYFKSIQEVSRKFQFQFDKFSDDILREIQLTKISKYIRLDDINTSDLIASSIKFEDKFKKHESLRNLSNFEMNDYQPIRSLSNFRTNNYQSNYQMSTQLHQTGKNILQTIPMINMDQKIQLNISKIKDSQINKILSIQTDHKDISCVLMFRENIVLTASRFNSFVLVYDINTKECIQRIDTGTIQGIKTMIFMHSKHIDQAPTLILGTYRDESAILSYKLNMVNYNIQNSIYDTNIQFLQQKIFEKLIPDAVSCLEQISSIYFAAGFFSGSISIFNLNLNTPVVNLNNIYTYYINKIVLVEEDKSFISVSQDLIRFHQLEIQPDTINVNITSIFQNKNLIEQIRCTDAFNSSSNYLKFIHFIVINKQRKSMNLTLIRLINENIQFQEEESHFIQNNHEEIIKDFIVIEPKHKDKVLWIITFGENYLIKLYEIRLQLNEHLKIWEKQPEDFLKSKFNMQAKIKLLAESNDYTNLKWQDTNPKVQFIKASEDNYQYQIDFLCQNVNKVDIFSLKFSK